MPLLRTHSLDELTLHLQNANENRRCVRESPREIVSALKRMQKNPSGFLIPQTRMCVGASLSFSIRVPNTHDVIESITHTLVICLAH